MPDARQAAADFDKKNLLSVIDILEVRLAAMGQPRPRQLRGLLQRTQQCQTELDAARSQLRALLQGPPSLSDALCPCDSLTP